MSQCMHFVDSFDNLDLSIRNTNAECLMLVCSKSINMLSINRYFETLEKDSDIRVIRFTEFESNPTYESVVEGVKVLNRENIKLIIAVGGGSAIDVAKCIKLYSNMNHSKNYLEQKIVPNDVTLFAVPTTAGTGSEVTRFAVIYYRGDKQSVSDLSAVPSKCFLYPDVLNTVPLYLRKVTMLDALCHAIESFWSVNSNTLSQEYSQKAIEMILNNKDMYLNNDKTGNLNMLIAANLAGEAINIAQTTAGHAMCYKLTSLYGLSHGHAAALCVKALYPFMTENTDLCSDPRGEDYLKAQFEKLNDIISSSTFCSFVDSLELEVPVASDSELKILCSSVNPVRLRNNPVKLDDETISTLYRNILKTN